VKGLGALASVAYPFLVHGLFALVPRWEEAPAGRLVLLAPVAVNALLLATFARTLRRGPSLIERLALVRGGAGLSAERARYCRRLTVVWCGFFALNGGAILALALFGSLAQWALYTGLVAYLLVAALFALELGYRAWRFPDRAPEPVRRLRRLLGLPGAP
jgi:uncharacterized membrane protein